MDMNINMEAVAGGSRSSISQIDRNEDINKNMEGISFQSISITIILIG